MSLEIAGEVQLRTYGQFLDEYGTQLRGIEEALEDSMCVSWDMNLDPISLQVIYVLLLIGTPVFTIQCTLLMILSSVAKMVD